MCYPSPTQCYYATPHALPIFEAWANMTHGNDDYTNDQAALNFLEHRKMAFCEDLSTCGRALQAGLTPVWRHPSFWSGQTHGGGSHWPGLAPGTRLWKCTSRLAYVHLLGVSGWENKERVWRDLDMWLVRCPRSRPAPPPAAAAGTAAHPPRQTNSLSLCPCDVTPPSSGLSVNATTSPLVVVDSTSFRGSRSVVIGSLFLATAAADRCLASDSVPRNFLRPPMCLSKPLSVTPTGDVRWGGDPHERCAGGVSLIRRGARAARVEELQKRGGRCSCRCGAALVRSAAVMHAG